MLQINPDAVAHAKKLDEERLQTGSRGYVFFSDLSFSFLANILT